MNQTLSGDESTKVLTAPRPPNPALWLFHLFLFPKRFFSYFESLATPFATAYAAIGVGIADACSSISDQLTKEELTGRTRVPPFIVESWRNYWLVCVAAGLVSAVLFYHLGGWWYRKRLIWAGDGNPSKPLAKRIYMFTCLVPALPFLLLTIVDSAAHSTPLDAEREGGWWWLGMLVLVFWSAYVGYRGVRTLFHTSLWRTRTWFLFLPLTFYATVMGGVFLLAMLGASGIINIPPDLKNPITVRRDGFSLQYPGNWWIDEQTDGYDPDRSFAIEPPQDAVIRFFLSDYPSETAECLRSVIEDQTSDSKMVRRTSFDRWGRYDGAGEELQLESEGETIQVRAFCASSRTRAFSVLEWADPETATQIEPGLALIRKSFALEK